MQSKGTLRTRMRADFIWADARGVLAVGLVEVGVIWAKRIAVRKLPCIRSSRRPLPLDLGAEVRARDPAALIQPGGIGFGIAAVNSGDRHAQPVLRRAQLALGIDELLIAARHVGGI